MDVIMRKNFQIPRGIWEEKKIMFFYWIMSDSTHEPLGLKSLTLAKSHSAFTQYAMHIARETKM